MNKQQKQIIITAVLVVVLIFLWINAFKVVKKKSRQEPKTIAPTIVMPLQETIAQKVKQPIYLKDEKLEWVRCPFSGKIYSSREGQVGDLELQGIFWDNERPQAIINNNVIRANDKVGIYTVMEISKDSVILSDGSEVLELKLKK